MRKEETETERRQNRKKDTSVTAIFKDSISKSKIRHVSSRSVSLLSILHQNAGVYQKSPSEQSLKDGLSHSSA